EVLSLENTRFWNENPKATDLNLVRPRTSPAVPVGIATPDPLKNGPMVDGAGFRLVTSSRSRPQSASSRAVNSGTLGSRSVTRVGPATATHDRAVDPDVVECDRLV